VIFPNTIAQAVIESSFNDSQYPISAKTIIHLDGKITTTLAADKIANSVEQVEGLSFVLQKIDGNFELSHKQKEAMGSLKLGSFDLLTSNSQLRVKNISMSYKLNKDDDDLWAGIRNISVASLFFDTPKNQQIIFQDFNFDFSNSIDNKKMKTDLIANLKSVRVDGKNYGEQAIEFSLSQLDAKSLSDIQKHAIEIQQQNVPAPILITQFYQLSMNLLSQGLVFDLRKFSLNTTWGAIIAKAHLELKQQQNTVYTPAQLLEKLSATAHIQIPAKLLEKIVKDYYGTNTETTHETRIQEWADAGWLKLMGNDYRMKLKYEGQKLFINDKLIPTKQRS